MFFTSTTGKDSQGGAVYVEAAIVIPVFFLFLFGIIQWGLILAANITLWNAASVAARRAVVISPGVAIPTNNSDANYLDVRETARNSTGLIIKDKTNVNVTTQFLNTGGLTSAHRVVLTYNLPLIISLVVPGASNGTYSMTAEATYQ